jgi:hypothetical protein
MFLGRNPEKQDFLTIHRRIKGALADKMAGQADCTDQHGLSPQNTPINAEREMNSPSASFCVFCGQKSFPPSFCLPRSM